MQLETVTRRVSFEVALFVAEIEFEAVNHEQKTDHVTFTLPLGESGRRPGEGPPRPLKRPTLPQAEGEVKCATSKRVSEGSGNPKRERGI